MDFDLVKVKDISIGIFDGPHATPKEAIEGPIFLGIGDIKPEGGIEISNATSISEEDYLVWTRRVTPQVNDIVFSYEATLHRYAIIPENLKCCLGRRLALIRVDNLKADYKFIYYTFFSSAWRNQVNGRIISGATVERISLIDFPNYKIKLPSLPIQRRIAEILGRYDALIENYAAQIRTLEASAQNLYREWFIRFRISDLGLRIDENTKLPVGWEEKELGQIAEDKRRIVKAKDLKPDMLYVGLEHLSIKSIVIKDWGTAEEVDSDKLSFEKNDILFGKIRPYLHKVCLSHFEGVCSSDTIIIKPIIENALGFVMFTVFADRFIEFADKISNGTKMPRAEWSVLKTYKLIVPPNHILQAFDKIIIPIFAKMENLQNQITKLRQMRDKLLPRLLSGKIEIKV